MFAACNHFIPFSFACALFISLGYLLLPPLLLYVFLYHVRLADAFQFIPSTFGVCFFTFFSFFTPYFFHPPLALINLFLAFLLSSRRCFCYPEGSVLRMGWDGPATNHEQVVLPM